MVTMSDIAKELGLSRSTVSFALRGDNCKYANVQIPESTCERVREAAERLGFKRNIHAEYLSRGKNPTIGVFLPHINDRLIADLIIGMSQRMAPEGFPLEFHFDADASEGEDMRYAAYSNFIQKATNQRCCGLISYRYFGTNPRIVDLIDNFGKSGGKILMLNSFGHFPEIPNICIDDEYGGRLAAKHLLEQGCGCFLHCMPSDEPRTRGFIQTLSDAGKQDFLHIFDGRDYEASALKLLFSLPRDSCPGLFFPSDSTAIRFMNHAANQRLLAGRDYLIIGYDGQLMTEILPIPLSTIFQPFLELGREAAGMMISLLDDRVVKSQKITPHLIERASSKFLSF